MGLEMPVTGADTVENRAMRRNPLGVSPVQRVVMRRGVFRVWGGFISRVEEAKETAGLRGGVNG